MKLTRNNHYPLLMIWLGQRSRSHCGSSYVVEKAFTSTLGCHSPSY